MKNNMPIRCIFMGTPIFSVPILQKLYDDGFEIEMVISQPDRPKGRKREITPTPIKAKALELGLEIMQPASLRDANLTRRIQAIAPDFIIVAAYGNLLPIDLLEVPRWGCINVHASLLPDLRGASPIQYALLKGYQETGITIMKMAEGLDSGPIFVQRKVAILANDNYGSLTEKLALLGSELLSESLPLIAQGKLNASNQEEAMATYAPKICRTDEVIDWVDSAEKIHNLIRALSPSTGGVSRINNHDIKIFRTEVVSCENIGLPGQVFRLDRTGVYVFCGCNCLKITELQMTGKKKLPIEKFISGAPFKMSDKFECFAI